MILIRFASTVDQKAPVGQVSEKDIRRVYHRIPSHNTVGGFAHAVALTGAQLWNFLCIEGASRSILQVHAQPANLIERPRSKSASFWDKGPRRWMGKPQKILVPISHITSSLNSLEGVI